MQLEASVGRSQGAAHWMTSRWISVPMSCMRDGCRARLCSTNQDTASAMGFGRDGYLSAMIGLCMAPLISSTSCMATHRGVERKQRLKTARANFIRDCSWMELAWKTIHIELSYIWSGIRASSVKRSCQRQAPQPRARLDFTPLHCTCYQGITSCIFFRSQVH